MITTGNINKTRILKLININKKINNVFFVIVVAFGSEKNVNNVKVL